MLYQLYESQRTLMEPFVDFSQAAAKIFSSPMSPMGQTQLSQRVSAGYSLMYRLGKDYEKPSFDIHQVEVNKHGVCLAINERIEVDKPFCELRRFKRFTDDSETLTNLKNQPAVLLVAPLSGHYSTLLRDTVKTMLKDHKVYITDWKNARNVPLSEGTFHLDDYVNYVQEFIRHLQAKYGNCHVISVCQPTVPVFAAISLMASRGEKTPLSMIMMGGPIDARLSPTSVNNLATTKPFEWFENNVIYRVPSNFAGKGRRVYPGFLQHTGFVAMNPDRHATSHYDFFKNLIKGDDVSTEAHRKFYDEYNAVLDMDADYYLETIKTVFQDFKLVNGTWDVMSIEGKLERVIPGDIKTTAVMTVEGELDDISGSGQTRAALDMCSGVAKGQKIHMEAEGAGHYGIFSGRRWRDIVYPAVKAFILEHNMPREKAEEKPAGAKKIAQSPNQTSLDASSTLETSATPVGEEAAKTAATRRVKTTTAGLKSSLSTKEASAKELSDEAANSALTKPMLITAQKSAVKPEPVVEDKPIATARPVTMPVATVAPAPEAGVESASNAPMPSKKSAA